ncbi:FAD-dependent oxidoreductase [Dehalobacter sp. DCM]|uniref:FAD-dependent oxidoreductase n=1 Tax=Dehalobacter sp. DCM TaxID=2907827 RepID=UPI0030818C43|nr:FAD-dependent oxidoreductase [Dehalobacter sp. DCM]
MSGDDKFDAIIIGAGPAGSACAYTLAKAGKSVLMIERGNTPGSKNVTGGRLYSYALDLLEPGLWEEAALERKVTHEQIMMLSKEQSVKIDYSNPAYNLEGQIPHSFTVLRAVFDEWLAGKAEEMGAMVACGILVDDLIEENGRIVGVKAGEDDMYADVVIAADGVNSFIAQKAGVFGDLEASTLGVGVKEIIELPAKTIEERFNLKDGEGTALLILGCTEGIHGGGFLYTNKESISLGCVFTPTEAAENGRQIHDIFQDMKMHPAILPLLEGGQTVEYGAHLVREEGFRGIPQKLYKEGLLVIGEAAGFVINVGYSIRGIDLAIVSGIAAAQAIISGKAPGPAYMEQLASLKLLPSMKAVDRYFDLLEIHRLYSTYPNIATDVFHLLFTVDGNEPPNVKKEMLKILKENNLSVWQLMKDGIRGVKSI